MPLLVLPQGSIIIYTIYEFNYHGPYAREDHKDGFVSAFQPSAQLRLTWVVRLGLRKAIMRHDSEIEPARKGHDGGMKPTPTA